MLDVDEPTAWRRAGGKRRPLARDRERFAALHAERAPVYEALADAVLLDGGAETVRRAAGALRRIPPGVKVLWAVAGEANYPVYVGDVLDGDFWPVRGRRFLLTDETVGAAARRPRPGRDGDVRDARGRGGQDAGQRRDPAARAGRGGDGPRRPRGRARRRRRGRRGGLLRGGLPARRRRRAGADDAGRPGRLRLRRQDRGGPPGGQELRRRLPPAARRAGRPAHARDAAAGRARRGLGRGDQDRADRRRAAVGARAARRGRPSTATSCWPARAPSSPSSRATSATPAAGRCSTSATPSGTRSRPRPATRATATARRSGSACSPR